MSIARIAVAALLAVSVGLAACGKRGDPVAPGTQAGTAEKDDFWRYKRDIPKKKY